MVLRYGLGSSSRRHCVLDGARIKEVAGCRTHARRAARASIPSSPRRSRAGRRREPQRPLLPKRTRQYLDLALASRSLSRLPIAWMIAPGVERRLDSVNGLQARLVDDDVERSGIDLVGRLGDIEDAKPRMDMGV